MKKFDADYQTSVDGKVEVIEFNGSMAVCIENGIIIITRDQAIDFFGLDPLTPTSQQGER